MNSRTKQFEQFRDPTRELEFAIKQLESFHSPQEIKRKAIEDVSRHRHRLPSLMQGSSEQKKLAERALKVMQDLTERANQPHGFADRLMRFFFPSKKQNFPAIASLEESDGTSYKISSFIQKQNFSADISAIERDLFRMKAISLLQSQGYHSLGDVMHLVRQAPINATAPDNSVISLHQTLTPFPGETVILKGSFSRNASRSVPLPETFALTSNSYQTGFPQHPILHTGFALPYCLIPAELHRPEELPLIAPLLLQKQNTAKQLMPEGELIERAKKILKQKQEYFQSRSKELLTLHRQFFNALLAQGDREHLFDQLNHHSDPIAALAEVYHTVNEIAAVEPYHRLLNAWKEHTYHDLFSVNQERRHQAASTILEREFRKGLSQNRSELVLHLSHTLAPAYRHIILQHLSELIQFSPPKLSMFEQKLQEIAYHQLQCFIRSFREPVNVEETLDRELLMLQWDIGNRPYVKELEGYFQARCLASRS